ncbi:MAG: gamma carbonic anhydrase family protein [Candidatus Binatia bacterium]
MILPYRDKTPAVAATAWVAPTATVIGDVVIGAEASIWFGTVLRGDVERIRVGARTNIQDNCTVHVTRGRWPAILGTGVTVGHAAVVHGCTVGDYCLVGIGAVLLDGVVVEDECLVAAGALLTPGTHVPARSLVMGQPARRVREITADEYAHLHELAEHYVAHAATYRQAGP